MDPDAFDILGIPPRFDLDAGSIDHAYLAAAGAIHPDLAAGSDTAPGRMAAVNDAKRLLKNPELRADILLHRLGGPEARQEKALPPGFLARMLSVREKIEEGLTQTEPSKRESHRRHWESWAQAERGSAAREVAEMFRTIPAESAARADALRRIRIRLNAWRYVERLIEQLDPGFDGHGAM